MRNTQRQKTIAFQGELGAFSHMAATKLMGPDVVPKPCGSFVDVLEAVKSGKTVYGVLPIENTLHGSILENYDNILEYKFPIIGETSVQISHQLIAMPGTKFKDIRRVFSHPVALNQCRRFFKDNANVEAVTFYDTAGSVKMLKEERPAAAAAIASRAAAEIYGGAILKRNIEDNPRNYTRFFLLTKQNRLTAAPSGKWKTSVAFSTSNTAGSLFRVMAALALRNLSLTKIESRPLVGKPWEYMFYVDFLGSVAEPAVQNALANLAEVTLFHRVLGSYPPTA